jgi:hypothetical protein
MKNFGFPSKDSKIDGALSFYQVYESTSNNLQKWASKTLGSIYKDRFLSNEFTSFCWSKNGSNLFAKISLFPSKTKFFQNLTSSVEWSSFGGDPSLGIESRVFADIFVVYPAWIRRLGKKIGSHQIPSKNSKISSLSSSTHPSSSTNNTLNRSTTWAMTSC